jgi:dihydroxy-acid dehydratase
MKSDQIKKGPERAPARAMLRATGLDDEQIYRPMIAVVNTWSDVTPCNMHLRELAEPLKEGIRAAGGTPFEFGSIVVTRDARPLPGRRCGPGGLRQDHPCRRNGPRPAESPGPRDLRGLDHAR